jgi:hypothetical protein
MAAAAGKAVGGKTTTVQTDDTQNTFWDIEEMERLTGTVWEEGGGGDDSAANQQPQSNHPLVRLSLLYFGYIPCPPVPRSPVS